ncbi:MAG: carboxymuconolactone decarboxylase family protein [Veillonella sp.]|nr:carboxymuconolactone decarboxylase family protein [Veillonella sp.]
MAKTEFAIAYRDKMFPDFVSPTSRQDPELDDIIANFAFDEVIREEGKNVSAHDRLLAILASLMGCGGLDEFELILPGALNIGIEPAEIKEMVYQAVPYVGIGAIRCFLKVVNRAFDIRGISCGDSPRGTVTAESRLEKGQEAQLAIFGEEMRDFYKSGPEETRHINRWITTNCFGDYYTRKGLSLRNREMVTLCVLMGMGCAQHQLEAHVRGNLNMGVDKTYLISIVSQCLPYIGYPRALNALYAVEVGAKAYAEKQANKE